MDDNHYLKQELYKLIRTDSSIFEFIQSSSLDGMWYWDLENPENEWMSPQFWEVMGYDPAEKKHLASEWQDMIFEDDLQVAIENFNKHLEDPSYPYDQLVRYRHKDGSTVWVRCRGIAIRDENGKPLRMLGAHNDMTSVMKAQEEIEEQNKIISTQSKIASLGEMLENIAHQWRQPLALMTMSVNNLKLSIDLDETVSNKDILECYEVITKQCSYLTNTINDFKNFSTAKDKVLEVDLQEVIIKAEDLIADSFRSNRIKVINNLSTCLISTKENILIQSMLNIFNNSKDAITENDIKDDERVIFVDLLQNDEEVKILIKDSGGGIQENALENIFEPYFTTKHAKQGTGLGLYMTFKMLTESIDSSIVAKNVDFTYNEKKLRGAEFTITIQKN